MKFSSPLIFACLSSSAVAFSPQLSVPTPSTANNRNQQKIFDPLGLYGKNSEERRAGLIQPLESSSVETAPVVIDPLSLYQGQAKNELTVDADMSTSVPFLPRPKMLDGTLPGDRGFDPLNLASDETALKWYRDAELKHSRLAMLAAVGWPLAELYHKAIATNFDLPSILNVQDKVPSVLNGGLDATNPLFWVAAICAAATLEFIGTKNADAGMYQGDYGFDPFGFFKNLNDKDRFFWKEAEIFNGRLAQLAIVSFVVTEVVSGSGIVNQTPWFFGM